MVFLHLNRITAMVTGTDPGYSIRQIKPDKYKDKTIKDFSVNTKKFKSTVEYIQEMFAISVIKKRYKKGYITEDEYKKLIDRNNKVTDITL